MGVLALVLASATAFVVTLPAVAVALTLACGGAATWLVSKQPTRGAAFMAWAICLLVTPSLAFGATTWGLHLALPELDCLSIAERVRALPLVLAPGPVVLRCGQVDLLVADAIAPAPARLAAVSWSLVLLLFVWVPWRRRFSTTVSAHPQRN